MTAAPLAPLAEALAVPAWRLGDDEVAPALDQIGRLRRLLDAKAVEVAAQAQQRGLPRQQGHRDLRDWVRSALPADSDGEVSAIARRAETLFVSPVAAELAPTREAFAAGQISGAQADVITATVSQLLPPSVPVGALDAAVVAEAQTLLLVEATVLHPRQLARVAAYLRHRLDPDADDRLARDETRQEAVRGLTMAPLASGMWHLEGLLTRRAGASLKAAVDAWSAPQPADDGTPDPRTAAQRRHDGLQRLAEESVAQPDLMPTSHGSAYRVVVTVSAETFAAALTDQPQHGLLPAELPDGQTLSSTELATIGCTAETLAVLFDQAGNPLDVGRTQYPFPAKQRLAIAIRDQHCTFPGCTAPPAWCDVHHLTPYSQGGRTAVSNGALLCGRHHRHVHLTGTTGRLADGRVTWGSDPPQALRSTSRATAAVDDLVRRFRARPRRSGP